MSDPQDIPGAERGPADDQSDGGDPRWTDDQRRQQGGQAVNESPTPDSMAPAEEFIAPRPRDVPPSARPDDIARPRAASRSRSPSSSR